MEQIDAKSVQFLNAVRYYGGKANITEIRKMTGMNRNEANYRFRKLLDMALIDVTSEKSPGGLTDRKVAHLTGTARRELEKGLGSATTAGLVISDEPEATEVSRERFRAIEEKLDTLTTSQKATAYDQRGIDDVEKRVNDLEEYIYEWMEAAETYFRAIRKVIERYVPGVDDMSDHFEKVEPNQD